MTAKHGNAAVSLAERAALGALLLSEDSELATATVRRLRPADFFEPWHAELFRTIRDMVVAGSRIDAQSVGVGLIDRLGPKYAEAVRVADCLRIVPPNPDLNAYIAMVIESSIRRELAGVGVLLQAGALTAVLDGSARPLQAIAAVIDATVDAAEARFRGDEERLGADPRRLGAGLAAGLSRKSWLDQGLAADRLLGAHPSPQPASVAAHEADLVAALVGRPAALSSVRSWLRADAINDAASRRVYRALTQLADRGQPIDLISVAWEAGRSGDGPSVPALLVRVEAAQPQSPGYLARIVAADHVRLMAKDAADTIGGAAEDAGRELWDVIGIARSQTMAVRDAASPLGGAATDRAASRLRAPVAHHASVVPEGRAG